MMVLVIFYLLILLGPNSGDNGQSLSVTISGSNMNYGNQWSGTLSSFRFSQWSGTNMFYGNPTSTSGDYLYGNVSIPNNQNTGWYDSRSIRSEFKSMDTKK